MKIILNILTHGDELIGLRVAEELNSLNINKDILTIQIANKKAFERKERFIDQDLNRSFPGKKNGNYEERTAYKLLPSIKKADIVIDIHSTVSDLKDAIIITKTDRKTLNCINAICPKYVLVMSATKKTALISHAKIGIAFEYGKDKDLKTLKKIVSDIKRLFSYLNLIDKKYVRKKRATKYFNVISQVEKPKGYKLLKKVKNYKVIKKGEAFAKKRKSSLVAEENFYPILFGEKCYEKYFGFKAKRIENKEIEKILKKEQKGG